jgi:hypothetical protein
MSLRSVLPLTATIPPGATARVLAKPRVAFRPERLVVSPHSFPLSLVRRAWTWPLVVIGHVLGRLHRGLAKLLRVDLYAAHERREYVSVEYAQAHADEVSWEYASWDQDEETKDEETEDEDEGRPFILVPTALDRRERLLAPLGRASRWLSQLRLRWQQAQLATLLVCDITISSQSQFVDGAAPLPAEMFATTSIDTFVNFKSCMVGQEITIDVHNGNRRACQLLAAFIGISADDRVRAAP